MQKCLLTYCQEEEAAANNLEDGGGDDEEDVDAELQALAEVRICLHARGLLKSSFAAEVHTHVHLQCTDPNTQSETATLWVLCRRWMMRKQKLAGKLLRYKLFRGAADVLLLHLYPKRSCTQAVLSISSL